MTGEMAAFVIGFFGDAASLRLLAAARAARHATAVAVVLDIGDGARLGELRDAALAAGAARCHALDVREEFLLQCLLPVVRTGEPIGAEHMTELATRFIREKGQQIAAIEGADFVMADYAGRPFAASGRVQPSAGAFVELAFSDGVPVSINGVPMTIVELVESLQTITGMAAADVLGTAYDALGGAATTGIVLLRTADGRCAAAQSAAAVG